MELTLGISHVDARSDNTGSSATEVSIALNHLFNSYFRVSGQLTSVVSSVDKSEEKERGNSFVLGLQASL